MAIRQQLGSDWLVRSSNLSGLVNISLQPVGKQWQPVGNHLQPQTTSCSGGSYIFLSLDANISDKLLSKFLNINIFKKGLNSMFL